VGQVAWKGTLTVNGRTLATDLRKGSLRREYEWGKVYTNQQHNNLLVVRIGGQPMFTRNIKFKGCVLVELTGTSGQRLVASRDRLQYRYNNELDDLLNKLAVDTRSALKQQRAEYKRYQGEKVKAEGKQPGLSVAALEQTLSQSEPSTQPTGSVRSVAISRENGQISIGAEFICKQCAGMETPAYPLEPRASEVPIPIDVARAERGKTVFERTCARCHGTYGANRSYPSKVVPLDVIGTDPARSLGMSDRAVEHYNATWFGEKYPVDTERIGYQAPPLDGIWATAPTSTTGRFPPCTPCSSHRPGPPASRVPHRPTSSTTTHSTSAGSPTN
jgi:hypothetical protein